ncbi:glycosyltransferase family 2 protein [Candidatus Woesearchaeota archaeon]|jgi:UDP-N-acetylglucosamine---dolichyl-phosphate N-acetylglucosaminyltransferase|nr:glycosyltransferase family 2 protein [Candidatus Woesearchaeota archaeon]MBT5273167.1 glycosyltransferase family 2 protein [Candidatus Woesearchaeota archaeon]MBT6040872.1 glycosyltransferase family 2 protein [Candidatus Woesearchaeota archaeon]MBT6337518.1 glycosyltransferase family 2 protein [Candidatus Woesearchaeota archaeon]MBT7927081.1 glycosyltransferase family 2 protein [Candidatus Woesearchaeota archaeon]
MKNRKSDVWAIIPAHNEAKNIGKVISESKKYVEKIVVVDDGSKDNTAEIAKKQGAIVLKHVVNLGKGSTLKTGCDFVYKACAKNKNNKKIKIILIDADGQHDPKLIPTFIKKLENKEIIFGARDFNKKMPLVLRVGNNFINFIIELLFQVKVRDSQSGYRAFWLKNYRKIRWRAQDYSMESEMIANVGKHKLKYGQVSIPTVYNDNYKGTTIVDGVRIVYNIFKWRVAKW